MIIAIVPVKNEDWILQKTLSALSLFCDYIIVGDAGSWDSTSRIISRFPKALYVANTNPHMGSVNRRQIILDKARELGSDNIIFCLDADETPSANLLRDERFWRQVYALQPGTSLLLEWISLWKSSRQYRDDASVWSHQYKPFIFRDDGVTNYAPGDTHESKVPIGFDHNPQKNEQIKILHFHFVLWDRMLAKQAYIRTQEFLLYNRSSFLINFRYGITREERGLKIQPLPAAWLEDYKIRGISFDDFQMRPLYWYDVEVLRGFKKFGAGHYRWLDIWDLPWENKRQTAVRQHYSGVPAEPVRDPRSAIIKFYHWLLRQVNIGWLIKVYARIKA